MKERNAALDLSANVEAGEPAVAPGEGASTGQLQPRLSWVAVLMLTLSCLSPVLSVCGTGADVLHQVGTGAAPMFLVGIVAAVVWAAVYAELGSAYPYAGGDYVGVGTILGSWAGFASLAIWATTTPCMNAFLAQVVATYVRDMIPSVPALPVAIAAAAGTTLVALLAIRMSALVTGVFLVIEMLIVVALSIAGLAHPARSLVSVIAHPQMVDATTGMLELVSRSALPLGALSAAFATVGGNQAIVFGEELQHPHRRMGRVILFAGVIGALTTAVPVISLVLGAKDIAATLASLAPFSDFMTSTAGPAAGRALSVGVILAILNALIAQTMFVSRIFFSIGRDGILHRRIGRLLSSVHGVTGVPWFATCVVGAISIACCFVKSHALLVFGSGLVVYSLLLVSTAVLVGRVRSLTGASTQWRSPLFPLVPALGLCLALAFGAADWSDVDVGRPSLLTLGGLIAAALLWYRLVIARRPGGWTPRLGS